MDTEAHKYRRMSVCELDDAFPARNRNKRFHSADATSRGGNRLCRGPE